MASEKMPQLYLASWNVAGWLTTVKHIKTQHESVAKWLRRHDFDVLCLQEVKTNDRNLEQHPSDHAAVAEGYESFWSPSRVRNSKGGLSGMAGVATFCKAGLCQYANRNVLDNGGKEMSACMKPHVTRARIAPGFS